MKTSKRFLRSCAAGLAALLCWLALPAPSAKAWNGTGHMIVAAIAYDQLPADTRARLTELLKTHPDFAKWSESIPKDAPNFDLGRYLFMRAATWPDDIRRSGSPYEHSIWHYIDYPIVPPNFPMDPAPTGTEDALTAVAQSEKALSDKSDAPSDRAAYLSWLIHLVGDIQQPLHCVTLINDFYKAPAGDKGGNGFIINLAGNNVNLHTYWDNLPGSMMDEQEMVGRAANLETKFPRASLPELTKDPDPKSWSLEGRALAIDVAYRRGTLPGGHDLIAAVPPLPSNYTTTARALAERRLALGGYRLADEIIKLKVP